MDFERILNDEAETLELANRLGKLLNCHGVVYLKGDLGVGKTTFCRGVLRSYDYEGAVKSPTFTIVEPYDLEWGQVYHFDLYRLVDAEELEYLGIDDYLTEDNLCLIEWPERGEGFLPEADLIINLQVQGLRRKIQVHGISQKGTGICQQLAMSADQGTKLPGAI